MSSHYTSPARQPVHSPYFHNQSYDRDSSGIIYQSRGLQSEYDEFSVSLHRMDTGFGFRIVGGVEEGSQVNPKSLRKTSTFQFSNELLQVITWIFGVLHFCTLEACVTLSFVNIYCGKNVQKMFNN